MGRRIHPRSGFTLIEMIVVMGIIILAAGFLVPSVAKLFQHRKLDNAGTLVTETLTQARQSSVTSKTPHRVVFLRDGVRLYKEPRRRYGKSVDADDNVGLFKGGLRTYSPSGGGDTIRYHLRFAGLTYEDIPERLAEEGKVSSQDIYLRFLPDGTIDFGRLDDISSELFNEDPSIDADIIIEQLGDLHTRGFIDIRPTGRSMFKIGELTDEK